MTTNPSKPELRDATADQVRAADGGRSDLGQQLQLALQEANNIYTRSAVQSAPTTVLVHEPKHQ